MPLKDQTSLLQKIRFIFLANEKRQIAVLAVLLVVGVFFEMLGLGVLIPALGIILNPNIGVEYPALKPVLQMLNNPSQLQIVCYSMSLVFFVYCIKSAFLIYLGWRQSRFSSGLAASLTSQLFRGYMYQPYAFHLQRNSAELIRNVQTEVGQFTSLSQSLILLTTELSVVLGSALILIIVEPIGALSISFFLFVSALVFHRLTRYKLQLWGEKRQVYDGQIYRHLMQGLGAIKDVKIYGKEEYFIMQFHGDNLRKARVFTRQVTLQQVPRLYLELLSVAGIAILIITMVARHKPVDAILPVLGVFVAAAFRMMPSVNRVMSAMQNIRFTKAVMNVLYSEFKMIRNVTKPQLSLEKVVYHNALTIENVSFCYAGTSTMALTDISIKIKKGASVGFIGPSGSGKSTLIDLIMGLITPSDGQICVDGDDIQQNIRSWQNQIGYVPQIINLTDDTIRRNVAFGIPDEDIDEQAMMRAIRAAQLDEFVRTLPEGLDTFVGERGVRLSGGQRQRIGIARSLYHDPELLILDEATSALDSVTEQEVMNSVTALQGAKTLIIIAHRLSTVANCDLLYRLEKGKIVQMGKPENMLAAVSFPTQ